MDHEMKSINRILERYETFKNYLPVYQEWYSLPKGRKKDRFAEEHEKELAIFRAARRELKDKYTDLSIPVKELKARALELQNAGDLKRKELEEARRLAKEAYKFDKQIAEPYRIMRNKSKTKNGRNEI